MGIAAGVLLGGILTTALGWQAIFFINVPIGVVVATLAARTVAVGPPNGSLRNLDVPGAVTAVAGLLALVYAVEGTRTEGWASVQTMGAFAAARRCSPPSHGSRRGWLRRGAPRPGGSGR